MDKYLLLAEASRKATESEIRIVNEYEEKLSLTEDNRTSIKVSCSNGVCLRVIKKKRMGFSSCGNLDSSLVEKAYFSSRYGPKANFSFPRGCMSDVEVYDKKKHDLQELVEKGDEMREVMDRARSVSYVILIQKKLLCISLLNTNGLDCTYKKSTYGAVVWAGVSDNSCGIYNVGWSCFLNRIDFPLLVESALDKITTAQKRCKVHGVTSAIFSPGAVQTLLYILFKVINHGGKSKDRGTVKRNNRVANEQFSLYDDGTLAFAPGSSPIDDEGISTQRTALVEKGIVGGFIYDLKTAYDTGSRPTGNGFGGLLSMPTTLPTNLVIGLGDMSIDEMLRDMRAGVIIDGANIRGQNAIGDFLISFDCGFRVENGEIAGRLESGVAYANIYELLSDIRGVGNELFQADRGLRVSLLTPLVYFGSLNVLDGSMQP
jgi:PmbA protein